MAQHFDWNRARSFLFTVEHGSFSAAARALGVRQTTVGRQVAALEDELGVDLFERVGAGVAPTEAGLRLAEAVQAMARAAEEVALVATGEATELEGTVSISASELVAARWLPGPLAALRRAYPGIALEVIASNDASDLRRREADIALRNFRPQEDGLIARKLREDRAHLYATPAYLASIGNPSTAEGLSRGQFIGFDRGEALRKGLNALGLRLTEQSFPLLSGSQAVQWAWVLQGAGIGLMLDVVGDAEPSVARALPSLPGLPVPLWLVTHRELRTSQRIRVVFDALADAVGGDLTG